MHRRGNENCERWGPTLPEAWDSLGRLVAASRRRQNPLVHCNLLHARLLLNFLLFWSRCSVELGLGHGRDGGFQRWEWAAKVQSKSSSVHCIW